MRVAAVWFPDWPIQAAGGQGPMVIARNHAVAVCDRKARRAGVRRGMRLRQAQALCPEAAVVEANPDRDGAAFAEVAAGLDAVAPRWRCCARAWRLWMRARRCATTGRKH